MKGQARFAIPLSLAPLVVLMAACASPARTPIPPSPEYVAVQASSELVVGDNRFPFVLATADGTKALEGPEVRVQFYLLRKDSAELRAEATGVFHKVEGITPHRHEDGQIHQHIEKKGVYAVDKVQFDEAGVWGAEFVVALGGRQPKVQGLAFQVLADAKTPKMGDPVPPSRNPTIADVRSIEEICTRDPPDNMHDLSVAQALQQGKPFVVVFSTPMFCVSRICGPVTDVVAELQGRYGDRMNFVHIEPWDLQVARGEGRLILTDISKEWNLPSEPWVFVVNGDGRVAARFEGAVSGEELEKAFQQVLNSQRGGY